MVRSMVGVPIYKQKDSAMGNSFPEIIVLNTATLACYYLIAPYDINKANELKARVTNDEGTGDLDKVRSGQYILEQDETPQKLAGIIREISLDASSTGRILDVRGRPFAWDRLKIKITSGGTLTYGSQSTITYDVFSGDDRGLKLVKDIDGEFLTGNWDSVSNGMEILASEGVYTTNDEFELECNPEVSTRVQPVKYGFVGRL